MFQLIIKTSWIFRFDKYWSECCDCKVSTGMGGQMTIRWLHVVSWVLCGHCKPPEGDKLKHSGWESQSRSQRWQWFTCTLVVSLPSEKWNVGRENKLKAPTGTWWECIRLLEHYGRNIPLWSHKPPSVLCRGTTGMRKVGINSLLVFAEGGTSCQEESKLTWQKLPHAVGYPDSEMYIVTWQIGVYPARSQSWSSEQWAGVGGSPLGAFRGYKSQPNSSF